MLRNSAILLVALLGPASPALASQSVKPDVLALTKQAQAQGQAGDIAGAERSLKAAIAADPTTSHALSMLARMHLLLWQRDDSHLAWHHRATAFELVYRAQQLDRKDPHAEDILDYLSGKYDRQQHETNPAAEDALTAGDRAAETGKCELAQAHYDKALILAPRNADALIAMGQCQEDHGSMAQATELYRKATALEPLQPGTWRALSGSLGTQKRYDEARIAALHAVAAMPSDSQSWNLLRVLTRLAQPASIDTFAYKPMGSYSRSKDTTIVEKGMPIPDFKAWMFFATSQAEEMDPKKPARSPFAVELAAWERVLPTIAAMGDADQIKDETMRKMLTFHKGGQLKAALFLLAWRESYRPEFEAWKKANPEAIERFFNTFRVFA
jgi:tetratricopeptide (TPR) repeat protein